MFRAGSPAARPSRIRTRLIAAVVVLGALAPATAGAQLFDFDSAPQYASLPIDQTVGTLTAHFSATNQGFSIQAANTMGFTPAGFGGNCIYPNSINAADLLIGFSSPVTDFSMLYAPQELACDSSAYMLVSAYQDGVFKGSALTTAPVPGTWPTGTLSYTDATGFNQVVVHYDRQPVCGDWGPIFMADNMNVTVMSSSVPPGGTAGAPWRVAPNPFRGATELRLALAQGGPLHVTVLDVAGRRVRALARGATVGAGPVRIAWDGRDDEGRDAGSGLYFLRITSADGARTIPAIRLR